MTFDVAGEAARAAQDRSAAWRFIEGFAAAWAEPIEAQDGWNRRDLAEAEERLGTELPEALKEALALFGRRPELASDRDRLLAPSELRLDGEVLVFRGDQWIAAWGTTLAGEDPEVLMKYELADKTAERWDRWLPRFSLACVDLVLSESLFRDGAATADRETSEADVSLIEEHFTLLPLTSPRTRWFAADDVILCEEDGEYLWVRARTPHALQQLVKLLPGAWEY